MKTYDRQAAAEAAEEAAGDGKKEPQPRRNVTDLDFHLMPVRGDGFIQGYTGASRHRRPCSATSQPPCP